MKKTWLLGLCALLVGALALGAAAASASSTTSVVKPSTLGGHWFPADTRAPGTGAFQAGPGAPPLGTGSFRLTTATDPEKVQFFTDLFDGVLLANIDGIGYSTYRDPASTGFIAGVAGLNLRVDLTGDSLPDAYLVYEPYQDLGNPAVLTGVWQTWDAYRGGAAKWWINTGAGGCGQNTPCTWSTIVGAFPTATIEEGANCGPGGVVSPCPGSLGVNQGSSNPGIITNVDALRVSVSGTESVFDFEAETPCTSVCYANSATGNDAFGGDSPASAKKTIQAAVNQVSPGGSVIVAAGLYNENVNVPSTKAGIAISGAQAGNSVGARTSGGPAESTVAGVNLTASVATIALNATGVTVDGFTIKNAVTSGAAHGLSIGGGGSGALIRNNFFDGITTPDPGGQGTAQAVYLTSGGADNVTISGNEMKNISSARSAKGVLVGDNGGTNPSQNLTVDSNRIHDVTSLTRGAYGVAVANVPGISGLQITNNSITTLNGGGWIHAVGLEGDTPGVVVTGNIISGFTTASPDAVAVWFEPNPSFSTASVTRNSLAVGSAAFGIAVNPALVGAPLNGTCNWWGDATGPSAIGAGAGSHVSPGVVYNPWLITSALNGSCAAVATGTLPANASGNEGSTLSSSGSFTGTGLAIVKQSGRGSVTDNGDGTWSWSYATTDNFTTESVVVKATDAYGGTATETFSISAVNLKPNVGVPTASPAANPNPTTVSASFTDAGTADTHTCMISWGDASSSAGTVVEASGSGTCSGSHVYAIHGTYTVTVTVTDDDGGSNSNNKTIVVPPRTPTDKDQCKGNGWKSLYRADGSPFKNQGDCIQYVNTGK